MSKRIIYLSSYFVAIVFLYSCGGTTENTNTAADSIADSAVAVTDAYLEGLNEQISSDPNNSQLYHDKGYYQYQRGNYDEGLLNVYKAIALDTANASYYYSLSEMYLAAQDLDRAGKYLNTCIRLDETYEMAYVKLAWIELALENHDNAMDLIDMGLRINPYLAEGYYYKGVIFLELGDTALAVSSFETSREQDRNYMDAHIQLGLLYALRKGDRALEYFNSAIAINPKELMPYYAKAMFFQERGRGEEALEVYDQLHAIDSSVVEVYYNKGWVYANILDKCDTAIVLYQDAIDLQPNYYQAYNNIGACYEATGDYTAAATSYRHALAINGEFDLAALGLSRVEGKLK